MRKTKECREKEILSLLLKRPLTVKDIATNLNIGIQYSYRLLNELREKGLIKIEGKYYVITDKGKAALNQKVRFHNIKVVLRIKKHKVNLDELVKILEKKVLEKKAKKVRLNNWDAYYIHLSDLNATVQINLAKDLTVVIHLPEFYASNRNEAILKVHNEVVQIRKALTLEGIPTYEEWVDFRIDPSNDCNVYCEYGTEIPEKIKDKIEPGVVITFNRNAKDLLGKQIDQIAKAWIDESVGKEVESNDSGYTDNFILMPERVKDIHEEIPVIKNEIKDIKQKIDGYNGFLNKVEDAVKRLAEATEESTKKACKVMEKQAEIGLLYAKNLETHIPYIENSTLILRRIGDFMQLATQMLKNQNFILERLNNKDDSLWLFLFSVAILFMLWIMVWRVL